MTDHDVAVATPSTDDAEERPDRSLAEQLVEQARADGVDLVGPGGLLSDLTKQVLETGLEVEMDEHLGYTKHDSAGRNRENSRNGTRSKTVITEVGPVDIDVPRDRDSTFEPATVKKRQRRLNGVDSMVISLTAKGLTTGEVQAHLAEVYGTDVSRETISKITDRVLDDLADIHADSKLNLTLVWEVFVSFLQISLNSGGAGQRIRYGSEISKYRVTCVMNDFTSMFFDGGGNKIKILSEPTMGSFLVLAGQSTVVSYVCVEDS